MDGGNVRFWGGLFVLLMFSDVFASEIVRVRLFTTAQSHIKISENLALRDTYALKDITEPITVKGENLSVNAASVPPHVILYPKNGAVEVIAVLDMEDYLRGVLPHEMPLVWHIEALKAQAVVARSFTLKQMASRKNNSYHLDSTVNDQMYRYNSSLTPKEKENLELALSATRDEVLETQSGQTARTLYHADCGGQTEKSSHVWGQKEVEFSVKDKTHKSPYSNWHYRLSAKELRNKLNTQFIPKDLNISAESLSERALQMEVIGMNKEREKLSSQEFRKLVGYTKIKSTRFQIEKINEDFIFKGSGFGHGVGLCQWGAKAWAQSGMNYKEILKHYFPSYKLTK